jgi:hypothetical protein
MISEALEVLAVECKRRDRHQIGDLREVEDDTTQDENQRRRENSFLKDPDTPELRVSTGSQSTAFDN